MLGSSFSIACTNYIMNTIVAEALKEFADALEGAEDFNTALTDLIAKAYKKHKRIIYNGNSYSQEWVEEARKRGLSNYISTVDALPHFTDEKNVKLLESHGILSKNEIVSRTEILLDSYSKTVNIEALTMLEMAKKQILPSVLSYERRLVEMALNKKRLDEAIDRSVEVDLINKLSALTAKLYDAIDTLECDTLNCNKGNNALEIAKFYHNVVCVEMKNLREAADALEGLVGKKHWPFPTYADLLYSIN